MTLPTNDDFEDHELAIEELEAIAAGFSYGGSLNWLRSPAVQAPEKVLAGTGSIYNSMPHHLF